MFMHEILLYPLLLVCYSRIRVTYVLREMTITVDGGELHSVMHKPFTFQHQQIARRAALSRLLGITRHGRLMSPNGRENSHLFRQLSYFI